jgi:DNA transformation protein and related proteins
VAQLWRRHFLAAPLVLSANREFNLTTSDVAHSVLLSDCEIMTLWLRPKQNLLPRVKAGLLAPLKSTQYNPADLRVPLMPVNEEYLDYAVDQLGCIGEVVPKKMFGGVGLYREGLFFGLIAGDVLYFKVDDENRRGYEAAGSKPFQPYGEGSYSMSYYEVPVDVLEDVDKLRAWARGAVAAAERKASSGTRRKKR